MPVAVPMASEFAVVARRMGHDGQYYTAPQEMREYYVLYHIRCSDTHALYRSRLSGTNALYHSGCAGEGSGRASGRPLLAPVRVAA
eukprot:502050-Rhodomonas_salina.2